MLTFQDEDEILDALEHLKNYKDFQMFGWNGYLAFYRETENNRCGVAHLFSGNHVLDKDRDGLLLFEMNCHHCLPQTKKDAWRASIIAYLEQGQKICDDMPDYVFVAKDVSYEGSTDYYVIHEKNLVQL